MQLIERWSALGTRSKLVVAGGAVAGIGAAVLLAIPSQVTWSDARASVTHTSPRLSINLAPLVAETNVTLAGHVMTPGQAVTAHGIVQAHDAAVIASRMTALITALPLEAGQSFGKGQLLALFDCGQMQAQLAAANASASAYRKTYDTNVELDQYKAIGRNDVAVSKANLGKAEAEARAISAGTGQCRIVAPFAGTVVERIAHPHDVAAPGAPLMKIQGSGAMEVELIVPSAWLTWLKPGTSFSFALEETGATVEGRVERLGAAVDPVSKTLRITGALIGAGKVLPGMSGTARFAAPTA